MIVLRKFSYYLTTVKFKDKKKMFIKLVMHVQVAYNFRMFFHRSIEPVITGNECIAQFVLIFYRPNSDPGTFLNINFPVFHLLMRQFNDIGDYGGGVHIDGTKDVTEYSAASRYSDLLPNNFVLEQIGRISVAIYYYIFSRINSR